MVVALFLLLLEKCSCIVNAPFVLPTGTCRYTGKFKDGQRHGRGVQHFRNGDVYDGMWSDDVINGRGIMTFKNGDKYVPARVFLLFQRASACAQRQAIRRR